MTYDELVTSIRNYTEVDSNVFSASVIDTFILMAENRILRDIDLDVFKVEATGTTTTGNKFLSAPSSILTHRYLMANIGGEQVFLPFRDTSFMKEYWPDGAATGQPKYYSVWDQDTLYLAPTPDDDYTVEIGYIARPTQLSSTNTTTWVSTNAPEALLYACLVQAYSYTKGPTEMLQYFDASYTKSIQGLGIEQQGRRRRDEYRDGMVRIPLKSESPGP
tara:strand:+ start:1054 stop:1710 length:657 start_codon:yes stop_codon:yes gene_type:complete